MKASFDARQTIGPRVALTTYSVKPRGGVVHTLELAEALRAAGVDVSIIAMGEPSVGFFRPVDAPVHMIPAPEWGDTLEERVFRWIEAMAKGLERVQREFDIIHSQDCISACAAARVRDAGAAFRLVRTVHHVDDFKTQALIDCQRAAILEPDRVLVVSRLWQRRLLDEYGVESTVVSNGVRIERRARLVDRERRRDLRRRIGAEGRFLYLTIGGIEPRKGSRFLVEALGRLKQQRGDAAMLAIIGGHSFQDYKDYRESVMASLPTLGLELEKDIVLLSTVAEEELSEWLATADGFVFPSLNEGWGLVLLEAASAGLPLVVSDIDVFSEFLVEDRDALFTRAADAKSLAGGMARLMDEPETRRRLAANGPGLALRYPWSASAEQHVGVYEDIAASRTADMLLGGLMQSGEMFARPRLQLTT